MKNITKGIICILCILTFFSCNKKNKISENKDTINIKTLGDGQLNIFIDKMEKGKPGEDIFIESTSKTDINFHVVFEDDGEAGYFYALNTNYDMPIQDALHIYNVRNIVDKDIPSEYIIAWTNDGNKSILFINNYPHAVIDFDNKNAYCRTDFPPNDKKSEWSPSGHKWNDEDYKRITNQN